MTAVLEMPEPSRTPFRVTPKAPENAGVIATPSTLTTYSNSFSSWTTAQLGPNRSFVLFAVHRAGARCTGASIFGSMGLTETTGQLTKLGAVYEDGGTVANGRELSAWIFPNLPDKNDGFSTQVRIYNDGVNSGGLGGWGFGVVQSMDTGVPLRVSPPATTSGVGTSASLGVSDLNQGEMLLSLAAVRTGDPLTRTNGVQWTPDHRDPGIPVALNTAMTRGSVEGTGARSHSWTWPTASIFTVMQLVVQGVSVVAHSAPDDSWPWPSTGPRLRADFDPPPVVLNRRRIVPVLRTGLELAEQPARPSVQLRRRFSGIDITAGVEAKPPVATEGQLWPLVAPRPK